MIAPILQSNQILAYIRCSDESALDAGCGIANQEALIFRYVANLRGEHPELQWDREKNLYVELDVSAWKTRLIGRPMGCKMNCRLRSGDHIVFPKFSRGFRNQKDQFETVTQWMSKGVTVHFADQRYDLSTALGRFVYNIMALMNQLEAETISERIRASHRFRKQPYKPPGAAASKLGGATQLPRGWKWSMDSSGSRIIERDDAWMDVQQYIWERHRAGYGWMAIYRELMTLPRFAASPVRGNFAGRANKESIVCSIRRLYRDWEKRDEITAQVRGKLQALLRRDAQRSERLLAKYGAVVAAYSQEHD